MDMLTGGLSLIGGLAGMFGSGNAGNVQLPPMQTTQLGPIEGQLNSGIPQLGNYNIGGQDLGQYNSYLGSALNNPYGGAFQGASNLASGAGIGSSLGALSNAGALGGEVPGMLGAAGQILNTGFDPQNALYGRTLQQVTDQTNAGLAGSGIGNTPWGQGVLGNTLSNFNIDWQNNLLGRESTAAGAAGGLINQAGNTATGAYGLGSAGASGISSFGGLPWSTFNSISGNPLNLLQNASQYGQSAAAIPQQQIGDLLQYLSGANQSNSVANQQAQLALNQSNSAFNQNWASGQGIGAGLGQLGKAFNIPSTFSFGGGGGGGSA